MAQRLLPLIYLMPINLSSPSRDKRIGFVCSGRAIPSRDTRNDGVCTVEKKEEEEKYDQTNGVK